MLSKNKFDFWIANNLNVLFVGKHGTGKTSCVKDAFENAGLNWLYFSASTMDPWVDFIGIPREVEENGVKTLDLVRPKQFAFDEVEALFFDEYNRAPKKIKNAVMELIQFKSINGKKFNNLRMVWAAINPEDDEELQYDVEPLDPAQKDRFHVHVYMPYAPNKAYFINKFSKEHADAAIDWWDSLPDKNLVTPRRLDYALEIWKAQGDLRDVIPNKCNVSKLVKALEKGPLMNNVKQVFSVQNKAKLDEYLKDKNYEDAIVSVGTAHTDNFEFLCGCIDNQLSMRIMNKIIKESINVLPTVDKHKKYSNIFNVCKDYVLFSKNLSNTDKVIRSLGIYNIDPFKVIKELDSCTTAKELNGPLSTLCISASQKSTNSYQRCNMFDELLKFFNKQIAQQQLAGHNILTHDNLQLIMAIVIKLLHRTQAANIDKWMKNVSTLVDVIMSEPNFKLDKRMSGLMRNVIVNKSRASKELSQINKELLHL